MANKAEFAIENARVLMVLRQGRRISTYPTVVNAARLWQRAGATVDIITKAEPDVPELFTDFTQFTPGGFILNFIDVIGMCRKHRYDVVIGYEPIDAELLAFLPDIFPARYVYHNIELRYPSDWKYLLHNWLERRFYAKANIVICQDGLRLGELRSLLYRNAKTESKVFCCVPNTYLQEDSPDEPRYLHDYLSLSSDTKILLYSGAIQQKKLPFEVVQHILKVMPNDWRLVLSGWSVEGYADELMKACGAAGRLFFYLETVDELSYLNLTASATAGLVWYDGGNDPNEYNIGLSSGKFWRFLTLGKKSIITDRPGMGEFARNIGAGVVIANVELLKPADFIYLEQNIDVKYDFFYDRYYNELLLMLK